MLSSGAWILLISYIGHRTPLPCLLLFPPSHFLVLTLVTRAAALFSGRLRRQVQMSARSCLFGGGWAEPTMLSVGAVMALGTVLEVVAVGRLELGLAMAVQTLLPSLVCILSPSSDLPVLPLLSPCGLFVFLAPLLAGVVSSTTVPDSSFALICALGAIAAQAALWCMLGKLWSEGGNGSGGGGTLQVLWRAAPIATLITSLLAAINLLFHLPLQYSLFPPPSFALFLLGSSILHFVSTDFTFAVIYEGGADLFRSAGAVVPRSLLVLLAAVVGGAEVAQSGLHQVALSVGSAVLAWSQFRRDESDTSSEWVLRNEKSGFDSPKRRFSNPSSGSPPQSWPGQWSPRSTSPPPSARRSSTGTIHASSSFPSLRNLSFLTLLPILAFLPVLLQSFHPFPAPPTLPTHLLPQWFSNRIGLHLKSRPAFTPPTLDIVFAFFEADVKEFEEHVKHVRERGSVRRYRTRVAVYNKGGAESEELRRIEGVDEVVELPNLGREGGTYLHHILRRFEPPAAIDTFLDPGSPTSHADLTLFLQHHLAWQWIADQRFDYLDARTGFLSLGPYVKNDCGLDLKVETGWERMKDIYVMFCPPTLQLSTWAAQFAVSRDRILANSPKKYARLLELLQAPAEHWLYTEGAHFNWHGTMSRANPYLGHALERSWPVIFNCTDPKLADRCPDDRYDNTCQCFDT
ncbi:hypothetical protein JCM8547_008515 [Rhodosporidiobolus lusitaniae]